MAGPKSGSTDRMGSSESRLSQLRSCASLAILWVGVGWVGRGRETETRGHKLLMLRGVAAVRTVALEVQSLDASQGANIACWRSMPLLTRREPGRRGRGSRTS